MKRIAPLLLILASLLSPGALADNADRDVHKSMLPQPG
jgi:hypothetical protein